MTKLQAFLKTSVLYCTLILLTVSVQAKRLTDWFEAEWFDDLVKIPLTNLDSSLWYANLAPCNDEGCTDVWGGGKCFVDNNNPYTIVYPNSINL